MGPWILYGPRTAGGVVFSNHPAASSSLSGEPVVNFTTRSGGTNVQTFVTFGYFVRF